MFLGRRRRYREESPEWICESRCRHQVRVRLHVFAGVFDPYTLPRLQFMLGLHFTHSLHFTHGPQSAFYTDRFRNTTPAKHHCQT